MSTFPSKIPIIAEHILTEIEKRVKEDGIKDISDKELLSLHSVFRTVLERALEILQKYSTIVAYTTTNKSKVLLEIKGQNDRYYRVFPHINYCCCRSFKHQVIEVKAQVSCKHILAARLAQILDRITKHEVTQDQYLILLRSMYNLHEHNG